MMSDLPIPISSVLDMLDNSSLANPQGADVEVLGGMHRERVRAVIGLQ